MFYSYMYFVYKTTVVGDSQIRDLENRKFLVHNFFSLGILPRETIMKESSYHMRFYLTVFCLCNALLVKYEQIGLVYLLIFL